MIETENFKIVGHEAKNDYTNSLAMRSCMDGNIVCANYFKRRVDFSHF